MSKIAISIADKHLLNHLRLGGRHDDNVGSELIERIVGTALRDPTIANIASEFGLSYLELCLIYSAMLEQLMPNPCINAGGLLLTPSLFFMEPLRFEKFANDVGPKALNILGNIDEIFSTNLSNNAGNRTAYLMTEARNAAQRTWDEQTQQRGVAQFEIKNAGGLSTSSGCMGLVLAGILVIAAFGSGFLMP
jgi:hypothetical protein